MKYKLLVPFVALLLCSVAGFSQGRVPIFQLGIKGGANITKIDGQSFSDEFKYGYHLGGFAILKISNHVQLQPEVLFNQFNNKVDSTGSLSQVFNDKNMKDIKLNYLSLPLLLNLTPSKFISFQVGPQFGILLDKHQSLFQNGKDAFNSGDFSMVGGVQLNLGILKLSGRYVVGLTNINDLGNNEKWKNQGFQLSAGIRII